jgi:hypothetical protein
LGLLPQNRLNLGCPPWNEAAKSGFSDDRERSKNAPSQSNLCSHSYARYEDAAVTTK